MTEGNSGDGPKRAKRPHGASREAGKTDRQSAFDVIAGKQVKLVLNGVTRSLDPEEAIQQKTYQRALGGNSRAVREVYNWIGEREEMRVPVSQSLPVFKIECRDPVNVDEALVILGIAVTACDPQSGDRPGLLITSDAIEAAIARKKVPLSKTQREEVRAQAAGPTPGVGPEENWE